MATPNKITEEGIQLMQELRRKGWTLKAIGEKMDCSPSTVRDHTRGIRRECPTCKNILNKEDIAANQRHCGSCRETRNYNGREKSPGRLEAEKLILRAFQDFKRHEKRARFVNDLRLTKHIPITPQVWLGAFHAIGDRIGLPHTERGIVLRWIKS